MYYLYCAMSSFLGLWAVSGQRPKKAERCALLRLGAVNANRELGGVLWAQTVLPVYSVTFGYSCTPNIYYLCFFIIQISPLSSPNHPQTLPQPSSYNLLNSCVMYYVVCVMLSFVGLWAVLCPSSPKTAERQCLLRLGAVWRIGGVLWAQIFWPIYVAILE